MIVKSSKLSAGEAPQIKHQTISTILNRATRMRRLLEITSDNNYTIFDTFPDLDPELFSPKRMTVINYERWLELIKTGRLISSNKGSQLYKDFKALAKEKRKLNLDQIYV
jgi:hypothetical protein